MKNTNFYLAEIDLKDIDNNKSILAGSIVIFEDEEREKNAIANGYVKKVEVNVIGKKADEEADDLESKTVAELKAMADAKGIKVGKSAKKADIIEALK